MKQQKKVSQGFIRVSVVGGGYSGVEVATTVAQTIGGSLLYIHANIHTYKSYTSLSYFILYKHKIRTYVHIQTLPYLYACVTYIRNVLRNKLLKCMYVCASQESTKLL